MLPFPSIITPSFANDFTVSGGEVGEEPRMWTRREVSFNRKCLLQHKEKKKTHIIEVSSCDETFKSLMVSQLQLLRKD